MSFPLVAGLGCCLMLAAGAACPDAVKVSSVKLPPAQGETARLFSRIPW
jgi:hypothetical protein